MSCLHEFFSECILHWSASMLARKQTMLAGYEDSMQACRPVNSPLRMHTYIGLQDASPASKHARRI